ncbi:hypothetical protein C482_07426 [Natrialba chahannaoensis JCM 10990]|uniref:Uncharacterized protein n=1 Tax=Natrialba chahannaoensis JCM 10990 TaxID=1227492 RepID=M0ARF5_9EURY|nr:DUF5778 family protein [Natrialba chahannaoensis]ELZ01306.1 hypothetical protein C482_07426 [Natrialba chahannaoensis JCM 10990]
MSNAIDDDLYQRTRALLEPGEIQLNGAIIHTEYDGSEDVQMMQATIDAGDIIAGHSGYDPQDCYVYSGNDDTDFSSNQHQGLTLEDEEFVWECQQLLRNGSFDIVIYYEGSADHEAILADIEELGFDVTGVKGD